ncbi:PREDICTED: gamma-glutamyltranspeptidase 2-like [Erythranthe guttata]|uniref:gamma-glutamyltranspeptidase 2-like n=1 Tax=Erythranthe guttata TaxID=4155 RepID=UPI00064D9515|nr:PREDICTED: gamma-glutamyltranspeptidase 2-like [Erythranthe guttata]|eukprot:XP_012831093.1 PREDICTED: gamma-glutamyltranspeptidase 2-like [Erythranthe guttata]
MFLHVCRTSLLSFAVVFLLLLSASNTDAAGDQERVVARNGVVATDETECSIIGRDVLKRGGHAVDAAVAAALCLGVVSPFYSGLGGGGFMLVRSSTGDSKVFDMREMAPGRASKVHFFINSFIAKGYIG